MAATSIRALKGSDHGKTIYVIGSGASVDHLPKRFFWDKITVTINEMFRHVPVTYALMHHHEHAQEAVDRARGTGDLDRLTRVVVSDRDWGLEGWGRPVSLSGEYYTYRTIGNYVLSLEPAIDVAALREPYDDHLVLSCCTASEALQFAGHLGAKHIVCCGLEGAALDGQWSVRGYNDGFQTNPQHARLTQVILQQTIASLRARGIGVCSLSPFVGADQEGHRFSPAPTLSGRALVEALNRSNRQKEDLGGSR